MHAACELLLRKWSQPLLISLAAMIMQGCIGGGGGGGGGGGSTPVQSQPSTVESQFAAPDSSAPAAPTPILVAPAPQSPSGGSTPSGSSKPSAPADSVSDSLRPLPDNRIALVGVNVAGAEFTGGTLPGVHGTHYFFPPEHYFAKWQDRGVRAVRFPIKWERLQPTLFGEFDTTYQDLIDKMLRQAANYGIEILLDVHNYGRYYGNEIGGPDVPFAGYKDLNQRIALRWRNFDGLYGYDVMNEPHGAAGKHWPEAAQTAIDGIRSHDTARPIFIEGNHFANAVNWKSYSDALRLLEDPYDNLIFSAHLYLDPDTSGRYLEAPGADFDTMIGVNRLKPFVKWLKDNNKRGHIGEFGVPGDDPRWLQAMDNVLAYLQEQCIPVHYWAAGTHWANYRLSIEPAADGTNKPQWEIMKKYVGQGNCTEYGPPR